MVSSASGRSEAKADKGDESSYIGSVTAHHPTSPGRHDGAFEKRHDDEPASRSTPTWKNARFERFVAAKQHLRAQKIASSQEARGPTDQSGSTADSRSRAARTSHSRSLIAQCSSVQRFVAANQHRTMQKRVPLGMTRSPSGELFIPRMEMQQHVTGSVRSISPFEPQQSSSFRMNESQSTSAETERLPLSRIPLLVHEDTPPEVGDQTTKQRLDLDVFIPHTARNRQNTDIETKQAVTEQPRLDRASDDVDDSPTSVAQSPLPSASIPQSANRIAKKRGRRFNLIRVELKNTQIDETKVAVVNGSCCSTNGPIGGDSPPKPPSITKSLLKAPRYKACRTRMRRQLDEGRKTTFMSEDMSMPSDTDDEYTDAESHYSDDTSAVVSSNVIRAELNNCRRGAARHTAGKVGRARNVSWWDDEQNKHKPFTMRTDESLSFDYGGSCNLNFFKAGKNHLQFIDKEEKHSVDTAHTPFDKWTRRIIGDLASNNPGKPPNRKDFSLVSSAPGTPNAEDDGSTAPIIEDDRVASLLKGDLFGMISSPFTSSSLHQSEDNSLAV